MKIAVCVKQVPDTWAEKKLDAGTKTLDRESVDGVMNELDEYAVEGRCKLPKPTAVKLSSSRWDRRRPRKPCARR